MSTLFGKDYADQYDLLYAEKDYAAECDMLENIFQRYALQPVRTILDLGCGTGNHSIPLVQRGYQVSGVDRSEEMLNAARHKAKVVGLTDANLGFLSGDVCSVDLEQTFDAVLMMFAVLGYMLDNDSVLAALQTVRRHLKPGGLFVCDVWYGPAVLSIRPSDRIKVIPTPDGQLIRAASGSLGTYHHLAEVRYHLWRISGTQVVSESQETHQMRYFFPQELAFFLRQAGLEPVKLVAFEGIDKHPDETTWNAMQVASL